MKKITQKKSGVALLWVLIFSSILIIISSTMISYIIKEQRNSVRITSSATSYSYARSGITWATWLIDRSSSQEPLTLPRSANFDFDKDGYHETTVNIRRVGGEFIVRSISKNNNVVRAIEYTIKEAGRSFISEGQLANITGSTGSSAPRLRTDVNNGSFEIAFTFWAKDRTRQELQIGASAVSQFSQQPTNNHITASIFQDSDNRVKMRLSARNSPTSEFSTTEESPFRWEAERADAGNIDNIDVTRFGAYRGYLRYIEDTSASFRIERNNLDGSITCVGAISLSLVGKSFGNLDYLFLDNSGGNNYIYRRAGHTETGELIPGVSYIEARRTYGVHLKGISIN